MVKAKCTYNIIAVPFMFQLSPRGKIKYKLYTQTNIITDDRDVAFQQTTILNFFYALVVCGFNLQA